MSETADLQNQPASDSSEQAFLKIVGQIGICTFLLLLLFYGICITGVVFKEPDIAFLLGQGRWIVEHGQIPASDPFSWTTPFYPNPYVIEKWLTEVIFYTIEKHFGLTALLIFDGIISCLTFVVIPYRIAYLCGMRGAAAMRMVVLTMLASMCHLSVRPEIFSGFFTAAIMEIMVRIQIATAGNTKIRWDFIILLAAIMCLWTNTHTLFILGILIPGFYLTCQLVERFILKPQDKAINLTVAISIAGCFLASLINPYGLLQWTYLPITFGSFNETVNDMQPLKLSNCTNPLFIPYYILIFTGIKELFRVRKYPLNQGDLFFRWLIPLGIIGGVKAVRSIPIGGLFLATGRTKVWQMLRKERAATAESASAEPGGEIAVPAESHSQTTFTGSTSVETPIRADSKFAALTDPFKPFWPILCIVTTCIGVYICTFAVIPMVPQNSAAFSPPFQAIEFIERKKPVGNMLNDPHFGATMIYKMKENPRVFVDPRYNLYGKDLIQNYWHIVNCDANCEQLLDHYKIDWVFISPKTKLPEKLSKDPAWTLLYEDKGAVIYARKNPMANSSAKVD